MRYYLTQLFLTCVSTIAFYVLIQTVTSAAYQPSTEVMPLVVQATVHAPPTPIPLVVVMPVAVEVTPLVLPTPTASLLPVQVQPTPTQTPVPLMQLTPIGAAGATLAAPAADDVAPAPAQELAVAEPPAEVAAAAVHAASTSCGASAGGEYHLIPMEAANVNHPDYQHGDLNLAMRGLQPSSAAKEFISYNGAVDGGAPQLAGIFADRRRGPITNVYQVRDWRWDCGEHGCASDWLAHYDVTLLGLATTPGETLSFPTRDAEIYGGGTIAAVLYAEETRLTLAYTRDGTVAHGYAVHLENLCVDSNLLAQYRAGNAGGRHELPGLYRGQAVGVASSSELLVAIRDRGTFMDPRSQVDWWQ